MASTAATDGKTAGNAKLPPEIWLMICRALLEKSAFRELFNCALVSRNVAPLALNSLYRGHESLLLTKLSEPTPNSMKKSVNLWRSLLLSSLDKTLFPYCIWIKSLRLGNFHTLLEDLQRPQLKDLQEGLFKPPLDHLQTAKPGPVTRRLLPAQDIEAVVIKATNSITGFVERAAQQQDKTVALTSLEGLELPTANLPDWVSRLSRLRSLSLREGNVLNGDVGRAIKKSCPNFAEVICFHCQGDQVDSDLGAFITCLNPNSLVSFAITSRNDIGEKTFEALSTHAASLKKLDVRSLERRAFESLNALAPCTNLENLYLEASRPAQKFEWKAQMNHVFQEVVHWLEQCTFLRALSFLGIPDGSPLLGHVLKSENIRLRSILVKIAESDEMFYQSLIHQTTLEFLTIARDYDDGGLDTSDPRQRQLVKSVCECSRLRHLNLMQEAMTLADVIAIASAMPSLEVFCFDGEFGDEVLKPLAELLRLKGLNIHALTNFTYQGLMTFLRSLASNDNNHEGLGLFVMNQVLVLTRQEENSLGMEFDRLFRGQFEIQYWREPGEDDTDDSD